MTYSYTVASELDRIIGGLAGVAGGYHYQAANHTVNGASIEQYENGNGVTLNGIFDSLGRDNGKWLCLNSTSPACSGGTHLSGYAINFVGSRVNQWIENGFFSTIGYDDLGRMSSMNSPSSNFSMAWTYDVYGNRLSQTGGGSMSIPQPATSFNPQNNQSVSWNYDAAGNVLSDGNHNYQYDQEGNLVVVDGARVSYYDAQNRRVAHVANGLTERFTFDYSGRVAGVWYNGNSMESLHRYYAGTSAYEYWTYDPSNGEKIHLQHQDALGRTITHNDPYGNNEGHVVSLPWGDNFQVLAGTDGNSVHYSGLDRDAESDSWHATFRQYNPTSGRWLSPDPYDGSYDVSNPQSLNRYAYVRNNPLAFLDPSGLQLVCVIQDAYVDGVYDSSDTYCTDVQGSGSNSGNGGGKPNAPYGGGGSGNPGPIVPTAPSNPMPSKLDSCLSKTWASTNKAGLALDVAGAVITLAAPEAAPLVGVVSALIGSASAFQSVDQGVSVSNYGSAAVSLGGASVSAIAPSAHFFAGASKFTASLKSVGRGFAGASLALDAVNFANGVSTCLSH